MTPVDLNRLREAWDDFGWNHSEATAKSLDALSDAAEAVLDAPTVYWCAVYEEASEKGCHNPETNGCGPVVLVPVKE